MRYLPSDFHAADERETALRALREGDEVAFAAHLFLGNADPNDTLWGEVTERVPGADAIELYVRAGRRDFNSDFCRVTFAQIDAVRRYDDDGQLVEVWPARGGVDD